MPLHESSGARKGEGSSTENARFWPFEVVPPETQTEEYRRIILFLETAFGLGLRPCEWHGVYTATSPNGRKAQAIRRIRQSRGGPRQWEVWLTAGQDTLSKTFFWVDDFDSASIAALEWLRGREFGEILPLIQSHVARGPGFKTL